jgi:RHS repeat-associated protein
MTATLVKQLGRNLRCPQKARENRTKYQYDNTGRLTQDSVSTTDTFLDMTVQSIAYEYNDQGQLWKVTSWDSPNGSGNIVNQVEYSYDGWGNISRQWQSHSGQVIDTGLSQSPSVSYTYDAYDRLSTVQYPGSQVITYHYYAGLQANTGRLGMLRDISNSTGELAEYDYLGDGTLVQTLHPQVSSGLTLNYGTTSNGYAGLDQFGRVITQNWTIGAANIPVDEYAYTYDAAGNRTTKKNVLGIGQNLDEKHSYDALNRLVGTQRGTLDGNGNITATYSQGWTLDQLGNWTGFNDNGTSQNRTTDAANEVGTVTQGGTGTTMGYDANGNMTFDGTYNYTYDAWNRLVKVTQTTGVNTATIATYAYDGNNYRVSKTVGTATPTDYYYNTNWQVLEEQQSGTMTAQYAWDARYVDTPICRFTPQTGGGTQTLYYTTDANNNVTALVNSSGNVVERYVYDPYGNVTVLNGVVDSQGNDTSANEWHPRTTNTFNNEILYAGYRYNPETGNYSIRWRDYEAPLGVWLQRDPALSGANPYRYCDNNPINGIDPLGQERVYYTPASGRFRGILCSREEEELTQWGFHVGDKITELGPVAWENGGWDNPWLGRDNPDALEHLRADTSYREWQKNHPLPPPEPAGPSMRAMTGEEQRIGETMSGMSSQEQSQFIAERQRQAYLNTYDSGFFGSAGRILDSIFNPAWDGMGNFNDAIGVMGGFVGAPNIGNAGTPDLRIIDSLGRPVTLPLAPEGATFPANPNELFPEDYPGMTKTVKPDGKIVYEVKVGDKTYSVEFHPEHTGADHFPGDHYHVYKLGDCPIPPKTTPNWFRVPNLNPTTPATPGGGTFAPGDPLPTYNKAPGT